MRPFGFAIILAIVAILTYGFTMVVEVPDTPDDACSQSLEYIHNPGKPVWICGEKVDLGITEQDFRESMGRNVLRMGTVFAEYPTDFVTSETPCIQKISKILLDRSAGFSDYEKADLALRFVQDNVIYALDSNLYGQDDFWAFPLETLYLGRGDCEDTSVLYASIIKAMGLDCVLLDYPGHCAVAVKLDNGHGSYYTLSDGNYYFAETTGTGHLGDDAPSYSEVVFWHPDTDFGVMKDFANWFTASYRYQLQRILAI